VAEQLRRDFESIRSRASEYTAKLGDILKRVSPELKGQSLLDALKLIPPMRLGLEGLISARLTLGQLKDRDLTPIELTRLSRRPTTVNPFDFLSQRRRDVAVRSQADLTQDLRIY
jgi:hypothetical protein